jgi:hypothetical protein
LTFGSALSGEVDVMPLPRGVAVLGVHAVLMSVAACAIIETVSAQEMPPLRRVRSDSLFITTAIARGSERSPLFRSLLETIDASDGLVYVDEGICGHGVFACLLHTMQVAGPHRVLRIRIDRREVTGCHVAGSIGHELQHAVEVLSDARIRSGAGVFDYFDRKGAKGSFETAAATQAGAAVDREVCRRGSKAQSDLRYSARSAF